MASLFDTPEDVVMRQQAETNAYGKSLMPQADSFLTSMYANEIARKGRTGYGIGKAIQGAGQYAAPELLGENPQVKARKMQQIRQEVNSQYKYGTGAWYEAVTQKLQDAGYGKEAMQAQQLGLQAATTESTIAKNKASIASATGAVPASVLNRNQQVLNKYAEDGIDVSNLSSDTFDKTSQLVTHLESLKDDQKTVSEEIKIEKQVKAILDKEGIVDIDPKSFESTKDARAFIKQQNDQVDSHSKFGKLAEDLGYKKGTEAYRGKVKELVDKENAAVAGVEDFTKQLGKEDAKWYSENVDKAMNSNTVIKRLDEADSLLDKGIYSGRFAQTILEIQKLKKAGEEILPDWISSRLGVELSKEEAGLIANTEEFIINRANDTIAILGTGALGSGTGISDKDREFMKEVSAGSIKLDEESIRRVLNTNRLANIAQINKHNMRVDRINKLYNTQLPREFYQGQTATNAQGDTIVYDNGNWIPLED